jgi:hypothetical protein
MPQNLGIRSFPQKGKNLNISNYCQPIGEEDRKILPEKACRYGF